MPTKILRLRPVLARVGLGKSSLHDRIAGGLFPKPFNLGPRLVGWLEHEIDAWIDATARGATEAELRELVEGCHEARGYKPDPERIARHAHIAAKAQETKRRHAAQEASA